VEQDELEARKCSLGATGQCGEQQMGLCCNVWVAKKDAAATETFRQAVEAFEQPSCTVDCSKVTCSVTVVSSCEQESSTQTSCSP